MHKPHENSDDQIVLVGLDDQDIRVPISPRLIAALTAYSQARLSSGVGIDHLTAAGIAIPALRELYRAGYFPANYRDALSPDDAPALAHLDLADAIAIPAFDSNGGVTDLCCWRLGTTTPTWIGSLAAKPTGILAPRLAQVAGEVVLVDTLDLLASRMASGEKQVFLLRPDVPVQTQVQRLLIAGGERRVRIAVGDDVEGVRQACIAAGLTIASEAPAPIWTFAEFHRDHHRAVFTNGDLTASIGTPHTGTTHLRIDIRRTDGRMFGDQIDLDAARQRTTFAAMCVKRIDIDKAILLALLNDELVCKLNEIEESDGRAKTNIRTSASSTTDASALLDAPDIIARFTADTEALGWIGDDQAKQVALLTMAGVGLDHPPWMLLRGPSSQTLPITGLLGDLMPLDHQVRLTRLMESALAQQGQDGLRHKLIVIDDAAQLRPCAIESLRVLSARGAITSQVAARDPRTGRMASQLMESRGPAGLIATSEDPCTMDDLCVVVPLDDSQAQTERVLASVCRDAEVGSIEQTAIHSNWRTALASLPQLPVHLTDTERLVFPHRFPRHRAELRLLLAIAKASARLHHRHRLLIDGHLAGTEADLLLAIKATEGLLGRTDEGLTDHSQGILSLILRRTDRQITIPEIAEMKPQWTRWAIRTAVEQLVAADLVLAPESGKGRRAHGFQLADGVGQGGALVHLRSKENMQISPIKAPSANISSYVA